jgi:putative ABC transport system substrate-binding protein
MRRRALVTLLGGVAFAWPFTTFAQQADNIPRIGYLLTDSLQSPVARRVVDAFRQGLRERGYVEGQNIVVEYRAANGQYEQLPSLAGELVGLKVDVIVTASTPAARALKQATTTIPIVVSAMQDPVGDGFVSSLARPGGNITGSTVLSPELVPKRLELLKEALPTLSRVAALWDPGAFGERTTRDILRETEAAAGRLGVQLRLASVRGPDEFERAFSTVNTEHANALLVSPGPMLFNQRRRIVELAGKYPLPSIFGYRESVELGGLISYGPNVDDLVRRSATFVEKILKGAKPGDLPIEQPTKFELVINLKTAKALGLTVSPALLARADEVIE